MKFYKYQGAGNDFLIADNRDGHISVSDGIMTDAEGRGVAIAEICDRRYGVGADGLMLLEEGSPADASDFRMTYFNSDGSGGMMCGNGGRCIVAFAADMGVKPSEEGFVFDAADGLHVAQILENGHRCKTVRLKMKDVAEVVRYDSLQGVGCPSDGLFMDTGTRHFVRMVSGLEEYDIVKEGRDIRYDAEELQPVGANVNFIELAEGVLKVRTYEKGVEDETFACGTGIVASAIAASLSGIVPSGTDGETVYYDIQAKRDRLKVEFRALQDGFAAKDVYLTGPAAFVSEILF